MRLRFTMLACALVACASAAVPSIAGAAPQQIVSLSIHAVPHSIIAGEPVLIYGRLTGTNRADQPIKLYHQIDPSTPFTLISTTTTDSQGRYEFTRAEGIVESNRSWYVVGPDAVQSVTVTEQVAALVSLTTPSSTGTTGDPLVFSGHVTPAHVGSPVALQVDNGTGADWHTVARTTVGAGSNFQFSHAWRTPGSYDVRAFFPADPRNTAAASDPITVVIEQAEVADFTIATSEPIVANDAPVTISGTLYEPGTTTPQPSTSVSLLDTVPGPSRQFHEVTTTTTAADGSYSFPSLETTTNELYQVRTTFAPKRHSAVLFEGVQDVLTFQASSMVSTVGGQVTFSGTVSPDKAGHAIYLQQFGTDGDWHTVAAGTVSPSSTYQFNWTFGTAGGKEFRSRITGGRVNVGNASTPLTIVVTLPPLSALPTS
ncbi:MAG: hypothetical protein ABSH51_09045 [Solirubrobacteraceae bacterium]